MSRILCICHNIDSERQNKRSALLLIASFEEQWNVVIHACVNKSFSAWESLSWDQYYCIALLFFFFKVTRLQNIETWSSTGTLVILFYFFLHNLLLSNISLSFLYTMGFSFVNDNAVFDSVCGTCYFMLRWNCRQILQNNSEKTKIKFSSLLVEQVKFLKRLLLYWCECVFRLYCVAKPTETSITSSTLNNKMQFFVNCCLAHSHVHFFHSALV